MSQGREFRQVERVGVLGAGTMGAGVAQVAAEAGLDVVVHDPIPGAYERARERISGFLRRKAEKGEMSDEESAFALARIGQASGLGELARADLVVEAIPEDLTMKRDAFHQLDAAAPEDTILATNTSSLSIAQIAGAAQSLERVLGMHFFNPVPKMKLVEIVRALETSDEAVAATEEVARRMGKETVLVKESPGFITSRINAMIGNEAFFMLQEGVATAADIDKAVKLGLNHPMGPFEMADLVGLDTRLAVLEFLHKSLGEKYRPAPLLVQHVKAGRLGKKAGRGVFDYRERS